MLKKEIRRLLWACVLAAAAGCGVNPPLNTFEQDVALLRKHTDIILLARGDSRVAVAPVFQGRVMTSTTRAPDGPSFGWLDAKGLEQERRPDAEHKDQREDLLPGFGGEERFSLAPESGPFSLFHRPGAEGAAGRRQTPPCLDPSPYRLLRQTGETAIFAYDCTLTNAGGAELSIGIMRTIRILDRTEIEAALKLPLPDETSAVAYESENLVKNNGRSPWTAESGMPAIRILGLYPPSPGTVVVIPLREGKDLRPAVQDGYAGKIPPDRLNMSTGTVFFKADGGHGDKIGIHPERSRGIAGSYDPRRKVLTLIVCPVPSEHAGYLDAAGKIGEEPFGGDALCVSSDGANSRRPPPPPCYRLETFSPAANLAPGGTIRHVQRTFHVTGPEQALDSIARQALGVSIETIKQALPDKT